MGVETVSVCPARDLWRSGEAEGSCTVFCLQSIACFQYLITNPKGILTLLSQIDSGECVWCCSLLLLLLATLQALSCQPYSFFAIVASIKSLLCIDHATVFGPQQKS